MILLTTERLIIRELTTDDATFILELFNTPSWIRYIGDRNIKSANDAERYLTERLLPSYAQNGFGFYAVTLKEKKTSIGICGFVKRDFLEHTDIGFAFLPAFKKQGYGLEAASAMLNYGKNTLQLKTTLAITNTDNYSSIKLLEKLGFVLEKTIVLEGENTPVFLYKL